MQSDVNQLRFRAQALTKQAGEIAVPGEMRNAQRNLLLSLSLLQEAMGKVAEKLPAALSTDSATAVPAVKAIAGEMQAFEAADVVYNRRSAALIKQALDDNEIGGQTIQFSSYLLDLGWLQPSTVARRINAQAGRGAGDGGATEPAPGLHGHGLLGASVGSLTLTPGQANRIPASSSLSFTVKVANQGDNPETDVRVRVRIKGAGDPITVQKMIDQTMPKTRGPGDDPARPGAADRPAGHDLPSRSCRSRARRTPTTTPRPTPPSSSAADPRAARRIGAAEPRATVWRAWAPS